MVFPPARFLSPLLQRKHPGVLLMIEVGYKMRFFGEDAETASRVCNILCFPDHNFLSASVPVQRTHVHIRRLVRAGYKVLPRWPLLPWLLVRLAFAGTRDGLSPILSLYRQSAAFSLSIPVPCVLFDQCTLL